MSYLGGAFLLYYCITPGEQLSKFHIEDINNKLIQIPNKFVEAIDRAKESHFNLLLMVKEKNGLNTDTIIIVNVNTSNAKINAMFIPRDTFYKVKGSSIPKINSAYACTGSTGAIKAVEDLLDVKIDYYVHINIETFKQIIDTLGGVYFDVPADLDYDDPYQDLHIHLKKGPQNLDGDKAEQLLRFRQPQNGKYSGELAKYYDGSDLKREEMQKKFIQAFIEQKINVRYISKLKDVLYTIFNNLSTNLTVTEIFELMSIVPNVNSDNIEWHTLPGISKKTDYWYFVVDSDSAHEITSTYFSSNSDRKD